MLRFLAVAVAVLARLPEDEGGFVHKRGSFFRKIARKVVGHVPFVGGIASELIGAIPSFGGRPRATALIPGVHPGAKHFAGECPPGFTHTARGCVPVRAGLIGPLILDAIPGAAGETIRRLRERLGPQDPNGFNGFQAQDPFGEAQMGRFGAGLQPSIVDRRSLKCPTGMLLGKQEGDGSFLCYDKLTNSERKWPRGRRPLLTGGEMRCINIASSAAKKLQRKQKQLEQLGLLKRPSRARRALPAGHVAQIQHG